MALLERFQDCNTIDRQPRPLSLFYLYDPFTSVPGDLELQRQHGSQQPTASREVYIFFLICR